MPISVKRQTWMMPKLNDETRGRALGMMESGMSHRDGARVLNVWTYTTNVCLWLKYQQTVHCITYEQWNNRSISSAGIVYYSKFPVPLAYKFWIKRNREVSLERRGTRELTLFDSYDLLTRRFPRQLLYHSI